MAGASAGPEASPTNQAEGENQVNIVYMGTPTFALPTLDALVAEHKVSAVFTRQDAVSHRGKEKMPSLVKARALELGIDCFTPTSFFLNKENGEPLFNSTGGRRVDPEIIADLVRRAPDFIVVAAYGMLLPREILDIPRYGSINIHASLLPRWRGAAPVKRALLADDKEAGVSIMRMETGLDTGPYCLQATTPIQDKNYQQLIKELGIMGAELLAPRLEAIAAGEFAWVEQDESLATYADKVEKGSVNLNGALTVRENYNRVRASSHHARCRATIRERSMMILEARPADASPAGAGDGKNEGKSDGKSLYFECSDGLLEITLLKPDGSREMTGAAFLAGLR
jgi:methionyl-tRNA formyltransferase